MERPEYCMHQLPANDPCEDGHVVATNGKKHLFAIIDGHGGTGVKNLIEANLADVWRSSAFYGETALADVVHRIEKLAVSDPAVGSCGACLAMIQYDPASPEPLTVASVGDCAVIAAYVDEDDVKQPFRLSGVEHNYSHGSILLDALTSGCGPRSFYAKGSNVSRISPCGKIHLQLSRSIGDANFKRTTAIPHTASDSVGDIPFVVLCSDGVTENLSDGEIVAIVSGYPDEIPGDRAAIDVVEAAESRAAFKATMSAADLREMEPGEDRRDVVDDMTAIVVYLHNI